jgi:hypothetical protein
MRDGVIGNPLARQQNCLAFARHFLWGGAGPSPGFQLSSLSFIEHKTSGAGEHAPIKSRYRHIVNN